MGIADYLKFKIGADSSKYEKTMMSMRKSTDTAVGRITSRFKGLHSQVAILLGGYGLKKLSTSLWDVAAGFEQMEAKLDVITKGQGFETLEKINKLALDLPVSTEKAVAGFTTMTAMGLQPTIKELKTMIDVGSILGDDVITRLSLQLGQAAAKGKIMGQDLNIMAEAGINARKYLKDAFNMTQEELLKSGIPIREQISVIFKGMQEDFDGSSERMKMSGKGLMATFKSYATEISRQFMNAGGYDEIKKILSGINEQMSDWIKNNGDMLKQKVPEYIDNIRIGISNLIDLYNAIPSGAVSVGGYGLLGRMLLGPKGGFVGLTFGVGKLIGDAVSDTVYNVRTLQEDLEHSKSYYSDMIDFLSNKKEAGFLPFSVEDQNNLDIYMQKLDLVNLKLQMVAAQGPSSKISQGPSSKISQGIVKPSPELNVETIEELGPTEKEIEGYQASFDLYSKYLDNKYQATENAKQLELTQMQESFENFLQYLDFKYEYEKETEDKIADYKRQSAQSQLSIAYGLGRSVLAFAGLNTKQIFAITKVADVGIATMSAFKAYALALANPPGPPWTVPVANAALSSGLWAAGAIAATGLGQIAMSSGGGSSDSIASADYTSVPAISDTETATEKGHLTITFEGDVIVEDEAWIEKLCEKISDVVEDKEVRLVASSAQFAESLA